MTLGFLFAIVVVVYLLQCICWAVPGAIVFALDLRGRGQRRQEFLWSALNVSALLANPLPPLSPLLVVQWPGFELTPDSIRFSSKQDEPISIPWEKLKIAYSEFRLRCNDTMVFKGSESEVRRYAELLQQLQRAGRGQRSQIIQEWLRKAMNTRAASHRVLLFARDSRWLRIVSNLQFFFLFLVMPLGFEKFGAAILWRVILVLIVISIAVGLEFWTLHKTLFPDANNERFKSGITVFLSPVAAIRASDPAAHNLLGGFHPIAVAGAVLSGEEFRRFAGRQLRLCRYGEYQDKRYQQMLQQAMEQALKQKGLNPAELLRPPEPDSGCVIYCPRCLAQYTKEREQCTDCGYEKLSAFAGVAQPPSAVKSSN
jgi:hypothetical protein